MKKIIIPLLGLLCCALLPAQTLSTSYFSEDFTYSYRMNPAFHPQYSFVGLPFIGSSSLNYSGSFLTPDVFYKRGGERVTFMNADVQSSDFLGRFKKGINKFSIEDYTNLLAIGFKAGGMYNIVDLNYRSYSSGNLPYDLMRYLKEGTSADGSYDLSGLKVHSNSFMEIGITSSWRPKRKFTIGMRFKAVIGLANSYIDMERLSISHSGDDWSVSSNGVIASAYDGYTIKTRPSSFDPTVSLIDLRNTEVGKTKGLMNGYGVGADLGIFYDDSSWQYSFTLSDVGCIFWFHNLYGHSPSQASEYTTRYQPHTNKETKMKNEFADMGDMLGDALNFLKENEYQSLGLLPLTARFGAKYLYLSDLSFGGLATFRYDDICPFWDLRGNVNYKPVKKVELIGSLGLGSYGITVGAFANAKLGFVNLFAGTDALIGIKGSNFLTPLRRSPNLCFGANIIW